MLFAQAIWEPSGHYPERGEEWKTGEEAETTRHGPKIQKSFSPVVAYIIESLASSSGSMVSEQSVGGKSLNQGIVRTPSLVHSPRG